MVQYRETTETKRCQFDKIEPEIIEGFLLQENLKNKLECGVNKYSWHWMEEQNDEIGSYSVLVVSMFEIDTTTKQAREVPIMKIIPVDKYDRIVQTSDQRKKYAERIARTQQMNQKMLEKGIKLKTEQCEHAKTPNFAPLSDVIE